MNRIDHRLMAGCVSVVLCWAGLFGCGAGNITALGEEFSQASIQGVYLGKDGAEVNLSVTLRADGCYRVEWIRGKEVEGFSRGRWTLSGDRIDLKYFSQMHSSVATDHIMSLKEFRILPQKGHAALVPDWDYEQLRKQGGKPASVCSWEREAPAPSLIPATEVPVVSIEELVAKKAKYKGKRVGVIGDYASGFELSVLRPPGESIVSENSLWIGFGPVEWAKDEDYKWVGSGRVKVVGTLTYTEDGRSGHLGMCPAEIEDIEYFQRVQRPGQDKPSTNSTPTLR